MRLRRQKYGTTPVASSSVVQGTSTLLLLSFEKVLVVLKDVYSLFKMVLVYSLLNLGVSNSRLSSIVCGYADRNTATDKASNELADKRSDEPGESADELAGGLADESADELADELHHTNLAIIRLTDVGSTDSPL
jgi:hypothetical protein